MQKSILFLLLLTHSACYSQEKNYTSHFAFGVKAGYNASYTTNLRSVNGTNLQGFHAGLFFIDDYFEETKFSVGAELLYSSHGYSFGTTGNQRLLLNYIVLPEYATFSVTEKLCFHAGLSIAYLMSAAADSAGTSTNFAKSTASYFNRFSFSFISGIEYEPAANFIVGARYNFGLSDITKKQAGTGTVPFVPSTSNGMLKNNLLQFYIGYKVKGGK